jgi:L-malate glycosyltransferase
VVLATAWETAEPVWRLPADRGRRLYLVYDVEFWETATPAVRTQIEDTFRLGMPIIAQAPAVEHMVRTAGVSPRATIIPGIDHDLFRVVTPIDDRHPLAVGFPMRPEARKGSDDAIAAVRLLRERLGPGLRAATFGARMPSDLPAWIDRWEAPTDAELPGFYNSLAVFVFPSHHEAWGLPGLEAQACGAALVAADNVGVRGYAIDGETALMVPPGRPDLIADAVERLMSDDNLRRKLATRGSTAALRFEWSDAVSRLDAVLEPE